MKTKVVYALVSGPNDCYAEQLLISLYSLRLNVPDVFVEVVIDKESYSSLPESRKKFCKYADFVSVQDLPQGLTPVQKSRYIKTSLRHYVKGDFLYLDTDTVVRSDLSFIDNLTSDICAVPDLNRKMKFSVASGWCYTVASQLGLAKYLKGEPYFNGGVIYVKDSPVSYKFFTEWHNEWVDCVHKGVNIDQIAFCLANKKYDHVIGTLDNSLNCQINSDGLMFVDNAAIIHYFSDKYPQYLLSMPSVQKTVKEYGDIPPFIKEFITDPRFVFASPSTILTVKIKKSMGPLYMVFRLIKGFFTRTKVE